MKYTVRLLATGISFVAWSAPAHAYIDPGTGTLIVQGLIGSFVAIATVGGLYLQRIRSAVARVFGKTESSESGEPE
ncbi:hypothetical protein ILP92_07110 [Maribius pontilimi]|uniref:Uncharacterized protein n=1 Tax=Palleronia pontilimi TaxID=1964209 RepID=A0A934MCH4_9RHOB|nr:hypothetical protein [Palleronia pontilimi]MBJ3762510.1 hypothetical protein [Palleronia pontilimi]